MEGLSRPMNTCTLHSPLQLTDCCCNHGDRCSDDVHTVCYKVTTLTFKLRQMNQNVHSI